MRNKILMLAIVGLTGLVGASLWTGWDVFDLKGAFANVRADGVTDDGLIDGLYTCESSGVTDKDTGVLYPFANWTQDKYPFYVSVNGRSNGTFRYFIGDVNPGVNRFFGTGTGTLSGQTLSGKSEFGYAFTMTFRFETDTSTGDYNVFTDGTADVPRKLPKDTGIPTGMGTIALNCKSAWNFDPVVVQEIDDDVGFDVAAYEDDPQPVETFDDESGIVEDNPEDNGDNTGDQGTDQGDSAIDQGADDGSDSGDQGTDNGSDSGDQGTDNGSDSGSGEGGEESGSSM